MSTFPAAAKLEGLTLDGGWKVVKLLTPTYNGTGGNFCYSYRVSKPSGECAHLKALDFSGALASKDPARRLQELTEAFNHERDLLDICREGRLTKIIQIITDGSVTIPTPIGDQRVQYIISEEAREGDIRRFLDNTDIISDLWRINCLHNVSVGIKQLHAKGIAHQDIKPSNVLVFEHYLAKIGDLGRASRAGKTVAHDHFTIAADPNYAPPEQLYRSVHDDFEIRRKGTDAYHLGSLISFLFLGINANALLLSDLEKSFHPGVWPEPFEKVIPALELAFAENLEKLRESMSSSFAEEICTAFYYLCQPNPFKRGHPAERASMSSNFEMRRFISMFQQAKLKLLYAS